MALRTGEPLGLQRACQAPRNAITLRTVVGCGDTPQSDAAIDAVGDFEEQRQRVLRHGERAVSGHIADGDTPFAGGSDVHHVIARGCDQNQAKPGKAIEDFGRDAHFV